MTAMISSVKLFGSPVLAALLSRPDMQGLRVAAEERQLRELAGRVAEGLAAQRLGAADAAARQMKSALAQVEALSGEPPVDAGILVLGFDCVAQFSPDYRKSQVSAKSKADPKKKKRARQLV